MRGGAVPVLAALAVAVCVAPSAGEEVAPSALMLGSKLELALIPPETTAEPAVERLPPPVQQPRLEPIPLPPVDGSSADDDRPGTDAAGSPFNEPGDRELLTLEQAVAMAISYHPALRAAEGRIRAAQGNWVQVGLRPNPEIGYVGEEIGDAGTAGKQGGFLSQQFVTGGKLRLNRSVASREVSAAQQRLEVVRLQVVTTVRILYFDVLAAERTVRLARRLGELASESVQVSELRLKALDIPRVSLLQSQIEWESANLREQQAEERHAAAWRRLATAIGADGSQPVPLEDALLRPPPELTWDEVRARVLGGNPELAALRFAVERARWAVQRASAGRVPNLTVEGGVAHDNASDDTIANVRVSMPLPVCDRNQGAIAQAYGELAAAEATYQQLEFALEQRLAAAMRDYTTARQRAHRYSEEILPVARQSLDMINSGYREGELDYLTVLSAQQTYAEKSLAYLQDLETSWKRWAEIDGLLVGPLEGWQE